MSTDWNQKLRGWRKEIGHRLRKRIRLVGIRGRDPILVYQMGKVGSSTVARTLEETDLSSPIVHLHNLNSEKVAENVASLRANPGYLDGHVVTSAILEEKDLAWGRFPCCIVTLTREPVGRAISFAFEDWRRQLPEVKDLEELDVDRMIRLVRRKLRSGSPHADPGRWFEREIEAVFGIDVMSVPYDFERGFVTLRRGPVEVLILRMEDLNRSLAAGLADLLDLDREEVEMVRANVCR